MKKKKTRRQMERDPNLIVPIIYDDVFKGVFGNEDCPNNTACLVSALTGIPYEDIKGKIAFKNPKNKSLKVNSKKSEKDIVFLVDLSEPLKVNLEVNRTEYIGQSIIERNTFYISNLFGGGLKTKNEYKNLKLTIQYNFNLGYVDKVNKKVFDKYLYRNDEGHILTEKIQIIHLNIIEMSNMWYNHEYEKFDHSLHGLFGLAAVILENEKVKFDSTLSSVPIDESVKDDIERIVEFMNLDDELITKYYDLEEERRKMEEANFEDFKKETREELRKELRKEITDEVTDQVTKEVTDQVTKEVTDQVTKEVTAQVTKEVTDQVTKVVSEKILQETQESIAINMYMNHLPIDVIAKCTNLSILEVNNLIHEKL